MDGEVTQAERLSGGVVWRATGKKHPESRHSVTWQISHVIIISAAQRILSWGLYDGRRDELEGLTWLSSVILCSVRFVILCPVRFVILCSVRLVILRCCVPLSWLGDTENVCPSTMVNSHKTRTKYSLWYFWDWEAPRQLALSSLERYTVFGKSRCYQRTVIYIADHSFLSRFATEAYWRSVRGKNGEIY